ncbi:hypothetical protein MPSEU_001049200 [Mayamaea pseudoterrestris]|nr:hypothetical protein MPSEU_001049200 [Mayamaea pseudoterrestris]
MEIDSGDSLSESYLFLEEMEALECIAIITCHQTTHENAASSLSDSDKSQCLARLRNIFDKYLECPTLLDKSIEKMVQLLAQCQLESTGIERHALSAVYTLSKVRGRKTIQRFLPHNVSDMQSVWNALLNASELYYSLQSDKECEEPPLWESVYTLWNWMNVLALVPFDITIFTQDSFIYALLTKASHALCEAGPVREAAAACLASWFVRPDFDEHLLCFVDQSKIVFNDYQMKHNYNQKLAFQVMGNLQVINTILKQSTAPRERLLQLFLPLWEPIERLQSNNNLLLTKLLVKWWTRMSVTCLAPRVAVWRYQRGKRCLMDPVTAGGGNTDEPCNATQISSAPKQEHVYTLFHVPDTVEQGMGLLIPALGHSSTIVRWSAAKGIGRITQRLPAVCAHDVLDAILDYFEDVDNDQYWHGACLALAELARRGLLLPERLQEIVPFVVTAILYDIPRGKGSVGAHVRDAACYTFWAFARAYESKSMRPFMAELSEAIVLTSLFDREVNCRRAASAAFQEAVGRQGSANFPNGIAILTVADFFSLGNRKQAYLSIAKNVASFDEYRTPIIRHLSSAKLFHWDIKIRVLASQSLQQITKLDPGYVGGEILPLLLEKSLDPTKLNVRHGAVLGVAEIILALAEENVIDACVHEDTLSRLISLVPRLEKARLYRGRGGEIMRSGVCRLVECISLAKISLAVPDQVRLLDSIDACIPHPSEEIQKRACIALNRLLTQFFPVGLNGPSSRLQSRVIDKFVSLLELSENPAATRGYSMALGYIPAKLLAPNKATLDAVLHCLHKVARFDSQVGGVSDAETRRNALEAMTNIIRSVDKIKSFETFPVVCLNASQINLLLTAFLDGLEDYTSDKRGDVGSWCRMAAMKGLVLLIEHNLSTVADKECFDAETLTRIVALMMKQLCEKLDTARQCAGACLYEILIADVIPTCRIAHHEKLLVIWDIKNDLENERWNKHFWVFSSALKVASLGLVVSIGDLTKSSSELASSALLEWLNDPMGMMCLNIVLRHLVDLLANGPSRVTLPTLKTMNLFLTRASLNDTLHSDSDDSLSNEWLAALIRTEKHYRGSDMKRLLVLVDVTVSFLHVLPGSHQTRTSTVMFLCSLLAHPFPRVRGYAAEQLYMTLLEASNGEADLYAKALELLTETAWTSEQFDALSASNAVATQLGVLH